MWKQNALPFTSTRIRPNRLGLRALLLPLLMAMSAMALPVTHREVQGLIACTGKLVSITDRQAVVALDQSNGARPLNMTFDINKNPRLDAMPGDRVDVIYAPATPHNIVQVLEKLPKLKLSEPHQQEPLGVAEIQVPEQLSAEVIQQVGGIEARGPNWEIEQYGQTGGGGPGESASESARPVQELSLKFTRARRVTSVRRLNPLETAVTVEAIPDARGVASPPVFIVNWLTAIIGPAVGEGSVVDIQFEPQDGRNIAERITVR